MSSFQVVIIGCGRMGKGITRMLLQEQQKGNIPFSLWIFDPVHQAEKQCIEECHRFTNQRIHSLRENASKKELMTISKTLEKVRTQPSSIKTLSSSMIKLLEPVEPHIILNAATYIAHRIYIPVAIRLGSDYVDLGQGLPTPNELQSYQRAIKKHKGTSRIIQEMGLAPGLANILAASLYDIVIVKSPNKKIYSLQMRVGGFPQHTRKGGDLHYGPTFSPDGLLYEYEKTAFGLKDGTLTRATTFTCPESWEDPNNQPLPHGITPFEITSQEIQALLENRIQNQFFQRKGNSLFLHNLQARPTADGTSKMCFDERYLQTVTNLEYKTLRFSPHYQTWAKMKERKKLDSLLSQWKKRMDDLATSGYPDMVLLRIWVCSTKTSNPQTINVLTLHDDVPVGSVEGFTAMQHMTGWPTVLLILALLHFSYGLKEKSRSIIFRSPNYRTSLGQTVGEFLNQGGIVTPYEILEGVPLLEQVTDKRRIPLCEVTTPPIWSTQ